MYKSVEMEFKNRSSSSDKDSIEYKVVVHTGLGQMREVLSIYREHREAVIRETWTESVLVPDRTLVRLAPTV
jgi:hypothetical protein